jgi:hypothetical protein
MRPLLPAHRQPRLLLAGASGPALREAPGGQPRTGAQRAEQGAQQPAGARDPPRRPLRRLRRAGELVHGVPQQQVRQAPAPAQPAAGAARGGAAARPGRDVQQGSSPRGSTQQEAALQAPAAGQPRRSPPRPRQGARADGGAARRAEPPPLELLGGSDVEAEEPEWSDSSDSGGASTASSSDSGAISDGDDGSFLEGATAGPQSPAAAATGPAEQAPRLQQARALEAPAALVAERTGSALRAAAGGAPLREAGPWRAPSRRRSSFVERMRAYAHWELPAHAGAWRATLGGRSGAQAARQRAPAEAAPRAGGAARELPGSEGSGGDDGDDVPVTGGWQPR